VAGISQSKNKNSGVNHWRTRRRAQYTFATQDDLIKCVTPPFNPEMVVRLTRDEFINLGERSRGKSSGSITADCAPEGPISLVEPHSIERCICPGEDIGEAVGVEIVTASPCRSE